MKLGFKRKYVKVWPLRTLQLFINAGEAKVGAGAGSMLTTLLAQYQVGASEFCDEFNERSLDLYLEGVEVPVTLWRTPQEISFEFKFPSIGWVISQMLQLEAESVHWNISDLEFEFYEEFSNIQFLMRLDSKIFKKFKLTTDKLFYGKSKYQKDLEDYDLMRISLSYIYLWDLSWFSSLHLGSTCIQCAGYMFATMKPFNMFIRVEPKLRNTRKTNKLLGFLRLRRRWFKFNKIFSLKLFRFNFLVYKFYYYRKFFKKNILKFLGVKRYNLKKQLIINLLFLPYNDINDQELLFYLISKLNVFKGNKSFKKKLIPILEQKYANF
jgi:ribosomal protein L11